MFLLLRLICQILALSIIVQAFKSSSEAINPNALKSRFVGSRGLNATRVGSNLTVIDSTTSPHASNTSTNLLQRVHLGLSADVIVQDCDNGNGSTVVQDCTCSVQQLAGQAIDDAITMVKTVMGVWNDNTHLGILQQYMGGVGSESDDSCTSPEASAWIDVTLSNLAKIDQYRWLQSEPNWITEYSDDLSDLSVYCVAGVPPQQNVFTAVCPSSSSESSPFGWVYTSNDTKGYSYFLGLCESVLQQQNFISRAAMLEQLQAGTVKLSDEQIFANYGRAALNLLVQLVPLINSEIAAPEQQVNGYSEVSYIAGVYGCETSYETLTVYGSLVNADNWALWITALYFNIAATTLMPDPSSGLLPITDTNCEGHSSLCKSFVNPEECVQASNEYDDNTMYTQYTSHWISFKYNEACTANFQCPNGYPAGGISGKDIKDYFSAIYTPTADGGAGCGICGSVYLSNGCEFTYNECYSLTCKTCNGTDCHHP